MSFPPDTSSAFQVSVDLAQVQTVQQTDGTYLSIPMTVTAFQKEYVGLRAWIQ